MGKEGKSGTYREKLLDPRWQKKRLEILERDGWTCAYCGDTESTLHVHHKRYRRNVDPWDVPDSDLVTLCCHCHEVETSDRRELEAELLDACRDSLSADNLRDLVRCFRGVSPGVEGGVFDLFRGILHDAEDRMCALAMMAVCERLAWKFSGAWGPIAGDVLAATNTVKGYDFDRLIECIGRARMAVGEQEIDTVRDVG